MAAIVLGIGTSHTPLFTLESSEWQHRADADYANSRLNLSDGRWVTYAQLLAETGPRYADIATSDKFARKAALCEAALDRLADALEAAAPDITVIVGDDERELFGPHNTPAFAIHHGEALVTSDKFGREGAPDWMRKMGVGYLMDKRHTMRGAPSFALELIEGLTDSGIDVASVAGDVDDVRLGVGHAFGFVYKRLLRERDVPIVPVLVNTYYPPNVPTAARCHDIGVALRRVIEASPTDARVAIVASGGLSHFVVDERLDRAILDALARRDPSVLRSLPRCALNSGSSEILNWVTAAAAVDFLPVKSSEYFPLYRTPAGTGVGAAFVIWGG